MDFNELLEKEITSELECLGEIEPGSEGYRERVDGLTKLIDRKIEIEKNLMESEERFDARTSDVNIKTRQLDDEKRNNFIKNATTLGLGLLNIGLTIWGTHASFKFEKEGNITTIMGRGFINRLFGKK